LVQLFDKIREEGLAVSYTMEDFVHDFVKERFLQLTREEQGKLLQALPPETRLAGLSAEQIRRYLDQLSAGHPPAPRKPRRKT
jgi:hypothetical protein